MRGEAVWFKQGPKIEFVGEKEINGSFVGFGQEEMTWNRNYAYSSFANAHFYDPQDVQRKNRRLFRGHEVMNLNRKITMTVMKSSDWKGKDDLSFVDCLDGTAFNYLLFGTSFDQMITILFDFIQVLQSVYCMWIFFKWLHSPNSCVQLRILHAIGCGNLVDDEDDIESGEIDNEVAVNNYFELPTAPPKYEA